MSEISLQKKNVTWNLIASLVNAGESIVVIMLVSRVNTLDQAGILTISFSLANLFMNFGKYGMKTYQIAHDGYDISFVNFLKARIVSVFMMAVLISGYALLNAATGRYSVEKAFIIVGVCIWYGIEAYEDVYIGSMQAKGHLHVGNKLFISRWIAILSTFSIVDLVMSNVLCAVICADAAALLTEVIGIKTIQKKYEFKSIESNKNVKDLLLENIPLCISEVAFFYITNISKYVIDHKMDDSIQAIYGYIAMPVFVISLLNSIIYQPQLMGYIDNLRKNEMKLFVKKIIRQVGMICGILIICLAGAYAVGIQVLSLLYNTDLTQYKNFMILLLLGGAFLAVGGFFSTVLVIMGRRTKNMIIYIVTATVGLAATSLFVDKYLLKGAVYGYLFTMAIMTVQFTVSLADEIRKRQHISIQ